VVLHFVRAVSGIISPFNSFRLTLSMSNEIDYENNPLHGLGLNSLLIEIVDQYGYEILFAYLNINCFKTNPSIDSSVKFLKKTDWAREKVEAFYLYDFKNLPRASSEQFSIPPRDRIIPKEQVPGAPKELSLDDAERLREKREIKSAEYKQGAEPRSRTSATPSRKSVDSSGRSADPWANWKNKTKR